MAKLTQTWVNQLVLMEVEDWNEGNVDFDIIASDVYDLIGRMRRRGTIDETYGADEMIEQAIDQIADMMEEV